MQLYLYDTIALNIHLRIRSTSIYSYVPTSPLLYKNNFNQIRDPTKVPFGNAFIFSVYAYACILCTRKMCVKNYFVIVFSSRRLQCDLLFFFRLGNRRGPSNISTAPGYSLKIIVKVHPPHYLESTGETYAMVFLVSPST